MGLKDQFNKLRNYFVEDEDDYDDYEQFEQSPVAPQPAVTQPRVAPVQQPSSAQQTTVSQPKPRPVYQAPLPQQRTEPLRSVPQPQPQTTYQRPVTPRPSTTPSYVQSKQSSTVGSSITSPAMNINIKEPHVYNEIMEVANTVKKGQTVLVNFRNMNDQQARRSIDFLTGIVYCLDGDIENISGQVFLVTPTGVTVEGAREMSLLAGQSFENFELS